MSVCLRSGVEVKQGAVARLLAQEMNTGGEKV